MRRNIIEIDEERCDGCGQCVTACAEGALQVIAGKARVVRDEYCDGLGACLGECPTGALRVVQRDAADFDAVAVEEHVRRSARPEIPVSRVASNQAGSCPSSQVRVGPTSAASRPVEPVLGLPSRVQAPDLAQWPVMLHLVPVQAPFFRERELVILSTCGPIASADVHWRFLRGRSVVVACPKLDVTDPYVEKLAAIFRENGIPRAIVARMEVPCCGGLTQMAAQARRASGRDDLLLEEVVIGLDGAIVQQRELPA